MFSCSASALEVARSLFFKITVLSYQSVEFSSKTLPPLPHSLSGGPEDGSVFSQVYLSMSFQSFHREMKEYLISTRPQQEIRHVDMILNVANIDIELLQT